MQALRRASASSRTEENRRAYREMLFTTRATRFISGVILFDETIRQRPTTARRLSSATDEGVIPGIKVDEGTKPLAGFPDEVVTEGLDGLRDRSRSTRPGGPLRQVARGIDIGANIPTSTASRPTPTRWPATRRCVRKPGLCRSSNPKC